MSDKKGRSEEKEDFFGNKYIQHFDDDGNEIGWSEEKTGFFGNKYVQHRDESGNKTGYSEEKEDFFGDPYTQHHQEDGQDAGRSEERTDFLGDDYVQHYGDDGSEAGWSEERTKFLGDHYTQYYDQAPPGVTTRAETPTGIAGSSSDSYSSSATGWTAPPSAATVPRKVARGIFGTVVSYLYWTGVCGFWCWCFFLGVQHGGPQAAMERIIGTLSMLWSPSADPVLNFLINLTLVIVGIALAFGIIYSGVLLMVLVICLSLVAYFVAFLIWVGSLSPVGTVLAGLLGLGAIYLGIRALARRASWNWLKRLVPRL